MVSLGILCLIGNAFNHWQTRQHHNWDFSAREKVAKKWFDKEIKLGISE